MRLLELRPDENNRLTGSHALARATTGTIRSIGTVADDLLCPRPREAGDTRLDEAIEALASMLRRDGES